MIAEVRLFELLKAKIGVQEAEAFITIMDAKIDEAKKTMKEDLNGFSRKEDMYGIKEEITRLEGLIVSSVAKCKADLIMWMVSNTIAVITVVALLLTFFRK